MKSIYHLALIAAAALSTTACVDQAYDLSKLDTEMNLFATKGIEVVLPDNVSANTVHILEGSTFPGVEGKTATDAKTETITVAPLSAGETSRTIESSSEFTFDFSGIPALYRNMASKLVFDGSTYFTLAVTSSFSGVTTMACEIFDATTNEKVGGAKDLAVPADNSGVKLTFSACGMNYIPSKAVIKNIRFTVSSGTRSATRAGAAEQVISMANAASTISPVIKAGSVVRFDLTFDDFLKELNVNVNSVTDVMDVTSFQLNGLAYCNVPAAFQGTMTGDASGSLTFEGPSIENGSKVSVDLCCTGGLKTVKTVTADITCTAKQDISLVNVDQYTAYFLFKSILLKNGIVITSD